jgi:DNA-binding transcriptional LysR family regulator
MELRDLEYLLACVEAGSFTKASRQAHAAQPTLSHAVKRLEDELGHVLLTRPKARDGRVAPTAAGALLVDRARRIRALLASLESDLAALDGIVRGPLAIGAAPSLAMAFVPRLLARMLRDYPEVRISVDTGASEALVERVRAGVLDAALCADIPTRVAPTSRPGLPQDLRWRRCFASVSWLSRAALCPSESEFAWPRSLSGPSCCPPRTFSQGKGSAKPSTRSGAVH